MVCVTTPTVPEAAEAVSSGRTGKPDALSRKRTAITWRSLRKRIRHQTKSDNYLSYHKKQFLDSVALCPKWEFVDFYVDNGASTPYMENAPEWCRLLEDCMEGKVDLIITQKVSNVSKSSEEISFCARMLAAQPHPVGIYFISEDIFTLASYYLTDLRDMEFMPTPDWKVLQDGTETDRYLHD